MMRLALALSGFLIYFIQAQLLPTIFIQIGYQT